MSIFFTRQSQKECYQQKELKTILISEKYENKRGIQSVIKAVAQSVNIIDSRQTTMFV